MIRLIHSADIHLDAPFAYLSFEKQTRKRAALRQALSDIVTQVLQNNATVLVIAGDLFNNPDPSADTLSFVIGELQRLAGQATVLIAPGNHDYYQAGGVWDAAPWPAHVTVFKDDSWTEAPLAAGLCVVGIACGRDGGGRNVLKDLAGKSPALVVMHGAHKLGFYEGAQSYPFTEADAAAVSAGYIALGHFHNFSRVGKSAAYYCGSPEGLCFDEAGARGALMIEVGAGPAVVKELATGRLPYEQRTLDCTSFSSSAQIEAAAVALGGPEMSAKIELTGTPSLDLDVDAEALGVRLADNFFYLDIKDRLELPTGDPPAGDRTVRSQFWTRMRAMSETAADDDAKQVINLATRLGLSALEGRSRK